MIVKKKKDGTPDGRSARQLAAASKAYVEMTWAEACDQVRRENRLRALRGLDSKPLPKRPQAW